MRFAIVVLAVAGILAGSSASRGINTVVAASDEYVSSVQQQPSGQAQIDVNIHRSGGGAWWRSPVWIAIGAIAFVLIVLLIVVAVRGGGGGGTTIIRE